MEKTGVGFEDTLHKQCITGMDGASKTNRWLNPGEG